MPAKTCMWTIWPLLDSLSWNISEKLGHKYSTIIIYVVIVLGEVGNEGIQASVMARRLKKREMERRWMVEDQDLEAKQFTILTGLTG